MSASSRQLIISGSPRPDGKSALLAASLAERSRQANPREIVDIFLMSDHPIAGCEACDACKKSGECIIDDDMQELYDLLDAADALTVVSPVYFAGPPAQFKAALDRFQRYFWSNARACVKRPAELYVIGDGGDPHGFSPLEGIVRSSLAVAGFRLDKVHNCVCATDAELRQIGSGF